jgi:hypothetical protein
MAEFCSLCAERMKLDHADFDVRAIARKLKIGYGQDVVCEGCSMITILKEDDGTRVGKIYIGYYIRGATVWRDFVLDLV